MPSINTEIRRIKKHMKQINSKPSRLQMNYPQAARIHRLKPIGDVDRDGVPNLFDCHPYNKHRQDKYFTPFTGLGYDSELRNPMYMRREKRLKMNIVRMTPYEYFMECAKVHGHSSYGKERTAAYPKYVEEYKQRTLSGSKMPLPLIDYHLEVQEGRHRAAVAEELGAETIPVMIVEDMSKEEWQDHMGKHDSERLKYYVEEEK